MSGPHWPWPILGIAPTDDPLPIVLAAAERGRVLVIHPSQDEVGLLAARLRPSGLAVAVLLDATIADYTGAPTSIPRWASTFRLSSS